MADLISRADAIRALRLAAARPSSIDAVHMVPAANRVLVVQGEHPFDPYYPLEPFGSSVSAEKRAAELTRDFLTAWWEAEDRDGPVPEVTVENWSELVAKHGNGEGEAFGRWSVWITPLELKP